MFLAPSYKVIDQSSILLDAIPFSGSPVGLSVFRRIAENAYRIYVPVVAPVVKNLTRVKDTIQLKRSLRGRP